MSQADSNPNDASGDGGMDDDALAREIAEALEGQSILDIASGGESANEAAPDTDPFDVDPDIPPTQDVVVGKGAIGTVSGVGGEDVFLEFGPRQQGVVPARQFGTLPEVGQRLRVHVTEHDRQEDLFVCTLKPTIATSGGGKGLSEGQVVQGTVKATNAGGLEILVGVHTAFLPVSHIELEHVEDMEPYVGQTMSVEVIEVDPERRRLVVSRRSVLQRERDATRASAVSNLVEGAVVKGTVSRIEPFGAFIDIGGVDGLLHISEIQHKRLEKVEQALSVGDTVKVKVVQIEEDGRRIRLSAKALSEDPYQAFVAKHPVGTVLPGTVTRIATYGAFLEVADGVEGLAHISQLASGSVSTVKEVLKIGQEVSVRVASVEPERKRLGLSLLSERGDLLTADVADDDTIRRYAQGAQADADAGEPTLGDLLRKALEGGS